MLTTPPIAFILSLVGLLRKEGARGYALAGLIISVGVFMALIGLPMLLRCL